MIDYEKMYRAVYSRPRLASALRLVDRVAVVFSVVAYGALVALSFLTSVLMGIKVVAASAVPFLLLSLFRRVFSAPRPYEIYDFEAIGIQPPREKKGSSFPSRHVFSAFIIGTFFLSSQPLLGALVLIMGVALGACRVLRGVHFIRDTIAGALIGAISGIIGLFIIT